MTPPSNQGLTYRQMLEGERFCYGAELVTTRGITEHGKPDKLVALGEALAADERISWLSVTDNPGGSPMLAPDWLADILSRTGVEIVVHLTCKDLNRNGLESAAWRYAAEGFHNLLALTGDYPKVGHGGAPQAVFDLDSVSLVALLNAMNGGLEVPGRKGGTEALTPTSFYIGSAASPFKRHERELMPQYMKLARKIRCGAEWVIPQLGFDMRKFYEVPLYLQRMGLSASVVGNVYVLNKTVAGLFHRNEIPGCVVTDELMQQVEKYAAGEDKGRGYFRELAAKQLAVFKGLGFAGGYLAGTSKAETFAEIIDLAESYGEDDWKSFVKEINFGQPDEFYLFEADGDTGLGDIDHVNREYLESLKKPEKTENVTAGYRASRAVHKAVFTPGKGIHDAARGIYESLGAEEERAEANHWPLRIMHAVEQAGKHVAYGCKDCGDCSLSDCAYICPESSCSKGSRNGPCGGSCDGTCELKDKPCLWARAYERTKYYGESEQLLDGPAVFTDHGLDGTSAWANTFLGRDHHANKKDNTGEDDANDDAT